MEYMDELMPYMDMLLKYSDELVPRLPQMKPYMPILLRCARSRTIDVEHAETCSYHF